MKKPTLIQIRTAVRQGKVNKVFRLYQKFTGEEEKGLNPIEEKYNLVQIERTCTNVLYLHFIGDYGPSGERRTIDLPLYNYPYTKFVKPYTICQSIKCRTN